MPETDGQKITMAEDEHDNVSSDVFEPWEYKELRVMLLERQQRRFLSKFVRTSAYYVGATVAGWVAFQEHIIKLAKVIFK